MLCAREEQGELHIFWDQGSTLQLVKNVEKRNIEKVLNPHVKYSSACGTGRIYLLKIAQVEVHRFVLRLARLASSPQYFESPSMLRAVLRVKCDTHSIKSPCRDPISTNVRFAAISATRSMTANGARIGTGSWTRP